MVHKVIFSAITFIREGSAIIFVITAVSRLYVYGIV